MTETVYAILLDPIILLLFREEWDRGDLKTSFDTLSREHSAPKKRGQTDLVDVVPGSYECVRASKETFGWRRSNVSNGSSQRAADVAVEFGYSCGGLPVEEELIRQAGVSLCLSLRRHKGSCCGDILRPSMLSLKVRA